EERWYNPIDPASSSGHDRTVSPAYTAPKQESNNRELMIPGHVDQAVQHVRQSSPRVSAVGSFHDGEVPSRSISEVTERSPIAAIPEDVTPATVTERIAPDGLGRHHVRALVPTPEVETTAASVPGALVSGALGPLRDIATDANVVEQNSSPQSDLTPKAL